MIRCPGQDQRFWKPGDIFETNCPDCGAAIEFWKDEPKLKCPKCKKSIANPKLDMGCAEWCQYAKQCLGIAADQDSGVLCDKLIAEMKKALGGDQQRINYTLKILEYADQIQLVEGGEPLVVKAAVVLHDIAKDKQRLSIVKEILIKYGINSESIEHICRIIAGCQGAEDVDSPEFKIVKDAIGLINIGDVDKEKIKDHIESTFKTEKARELAAKLV